MDDKLIIRRYLSADHDDVWALHNAALRDTGAHLGNGPWDDDLHCIEAAYLEAGGEFLVSDFDGRIVAMGALKPTDAGVSEVKRMRVDPAFQLRGFGQEMLSALEARARALEFRKLILDTSVRQKAALHLYQKNGYRETARRKIRNLEVIDFEKDLDE